MNYYTTFIVPLRARKMARVVSLPAGGQITVRPDFLPPTEANALLQELIETVPWVQGHYVYGGRSVPTPRLLWAMGDRVSPAYTVTGSSPWTPAMRRVCDALFDECGIRPGYAQLNLYRDGNDSISWHADREVCSGDHIASLSLGATRDFALRPGRAGKATHTLALQHNMLIVMDQQAASTRYQHCVPKTKAQVGYRVSITFREK